MWTAPKILVQILFTGFCALQMTILILIISMALVGQNGLALLNIIELIFPIMAILAVWLWDDDKPHVCGPIACETFMTIYTSWTFISFLFELLLLLYRRAVFSSSSGAFVAVFGSDPSQLDPKLITLNYLAVVFLFLGIPVGLLVRRRVKQAEAECKTRPQPFPPLHKARVDHGFA